MIDIVVACRVGAEEVESEGFKDGTRLTVKCEFPLTGTSEITCSIHNESSETLEWVLRSQASGFGFKLLDKERQEISPNEEWAMLWAPKPEHGRHSPKLLEPGESIELTYPLGKVYGEAASKAQSVEVEWQTGFDAVDKVWSIITSLERSAEMKRLSTKTDLLKGSILKDRSESRVVSISQKFSKNTHRTKLQSWWIRVFGLLFIVGTIFVWYRVKQSGRN